MEGGKAHATKGETPTTITVAQYMSKDTTQTGREMILCKQSLSATWKALNNL